MMTMTTKTGTTSKTRTTTYMDDEGDDFKEDDDDQRFHLHRTCKDLAHRRDDRSFNKNEGRGQ